MTAPDVLFLHSFGLDGGAARWLDVPNLVAPTLLGHGPSEPARPEISLPDMVEQIAGSLSSPVDVIGCSVGGMLALHLALDHPGLVRSLALVCTAAWVPRQIILDRADETTSASRADFVDSTLQRWFTPAALTEPAEPVQYAIDRLWAADRPRLAEVWRAVSRHDVRSRLAEISVPTICIAGRQDISAPPARSEELKEGIRSARMVTLSAAHMAYLEQPGPFGTIIRNHLHDVHA
ncbi:MAG: 3-oxoadipate enol-lactonase [Subtercola sp.]|nr:3-oxoadipate enol-lactonase [Subtercola sp.]